MLREADFPNSAMSVTAGALQLRHGARGGRGGGAHERPDVLARSCRCGLGLDLLRCVLWRCGPDRAPAEPPTPRAPAQPATRIIAWAPSTWGGAWRGRPGRVGGGHDIRSQVPLRRLPLSRRDHQPRRLALFRFPLSLRMVEEML